MGLVHAHKMRFWYLLGVFSKLTGKHPRHFYRGVPPGKGGGVICGSPWESVAGVKIVPQELTACRISHTTLTVSSSKLAATALLCCKQYFYQIMRNLSSFYSTTLTDLYIFKILIVFFGQLQKSCGNLSETAKLNEEIGSNESMSHEFTLHG